MKWFVTARDAFHIIHNDFIHCLRENIEQCSFKLSLRTIFRLEIKIKLNIQLFFLPNWLKKSVCIIIKVFLS